MAVLIHLPMEPAPERRGIAFWMRKTRKELEGVRESQDSDAVHDLRVVLRRCREIGTTLAEVDPHPAWGEMRECSKKLFRRLGELHDAQVQRDWIKKVTTGEDKLGEALSQRLEKEETSLREAALKAAERFDEDKWIGLRETLGSRARFVPPGGLAAKCLALERLEEAQELHARALRTERSKPWHKLRIGLKRFRYATEALLPEHYAAWKKDLKRVQDLLGDIHDLDVVRETAQEIADGELQAELAALEQTIARERAARVRTYRQLTLGTTSLWKRWRLGLPTNGEVEKAARARIEVTARAGDPHTKRTRAEAKVTQGIVSALHKTRAARVFGHPEFRRALAAAGRLQGLRAKTSRKAAKKFLAQQPPPPGWREETWRMVARAVRYERGAEPKLDGKKTAKLNDEQKKSLYLLAGALRLGRALHKAGLSSGKGLRAMRLDETVVLRVAGVKDSEENSAKLAAAKHLLERGLGMPLLIRLPAVTEEIIQLDSPPVRELARVAAAP